MYTWVYFFTIFLLSYNRLSVAQVNDILLAIYVGYFSRILDIFNKAEVDYNILSIDISYIIDIKMDYIIKGEILCIPFY